MTRAFGFGGARRSCVMVSRLGGSAAPVTDTASTNGSGTATSTSAQGVDKAYLQSGVYELEIATERVPAQLQLGALVDPKGLRIRS